MKTENLRIGMNVAHPNYGVGTVRAIGQKTADILFDGVVHTVSPEESHLEPAEPYALVSGLEIPLAQLIEQTVHALVSDLKLEKEGHIPDSIVQELGSRWHNGRLVLHTADPSNQPKEVPLETFFHKIVMVRNNLRVLEQKINSHEKLTDAEKVELQQYVSRCHGSMTTFNLLFAAREGQFSSKS
jgi:hypothetical protein